MKTSLYDLSKQDLEQLLRGTYSDTISITRKVNSGYLSREEYLYKIERITRLERSLLAAMQDLERAEARHKLA